MNLNKCVKKDSLDAGVYIFAGKQGVGKTSLGAGIFSYDYKFWRKERVKMAMELAKRYYDDTGISLDIDKCLYFSNTKFLLDKRAGISTHYIDVQRLGLPNPDYQVQYLPRGSCIYIQEGDILQFCQDNKTLSKYLINLYKFARHLQLTIIIDCQVFGRIDKSVRMLSMGIYYITDSYDKRFLFFWKRRVWKFIYIDNQLNDVVKELAQVGVHIKISVVQKGKFKFKGNIFDRYDSFSAVPYFMNGIDKVGYEYLEYPENSLSLEAIKAFMEMHPLERPDIMERRKRKQIVQEEDDAEEKEEEIEILVKPRKPLLLKKYDNR